MKNPDEENAILNRPEQEWRYENGFPVEPLSEVMKGQPMTTLTQPKVDAMRAAAVAIKTAYDVDNLKALLDRFTGHASGDGAVNIHSDYTDVCVAREQARLRVETLETAAKDQEADLLEQAATAGTNETARKAAFAKFKKEDAALQETNAAIHAAKSELAILEGKAKGMYGELTAITAKCNLVRTELAVLGIEADSVPAF